MSGRLRNMTSIYLFTQATSQMPCLHDKILLLYRQGGRVSNNLWTGSAGGHFEEFELNDAKACVLRELNEEIGITEEELSDLELKYITLRNVGGEIRQNYYFFARVNRDISVSSTEGILKWFPIDEIGNLEMPFTAKYVIRHYVSEGMRNDRIYGGAATKDGVIFTELDDF